MGDNRLTCADDTRLYISDKSKRGTALQFIAVINGLGCRSCPLSKREERRIRKMPRIIRRNRLLGLKVTRILRHLTQFRRCKKKVAMSPKIPSLVQQDFLNNLLLVGFAMVPGNNGLFF